MNESTPQEIVILHTSYHPKGRVLRRGARGQVLGVGTSGGGSRKVRSVSIVVDGAAYVVYPFDIRVWTPLWAIAQAARG